MAVPESVPESVPLATERSPLGFSYDVGSEGVEPFTPGPHGSVKDATYPATERLVRKTQEFLSVGVDPAKIGPWEEALNDEERAAYFDDKHYRRQLVKADGGEVTLWDGIEVSEENDPMVQHMLADFELRTRSHVALAALHTYEASWEMRMAYKAYLARLRVRDAITGFWTWLRKTEPR